MRKRGRKGEEEGIVRKRNRGIEQNRKERRGRKQV